MAFSARSDQVPMQTADLAFLAVFTLVLTAVFSVPARAYSGEAVQYFSEGNALVATENYLQAVAVFDKALALEPAYYEAWDRKADALNRAGEFSEALAASTKALDLNPRYARGWINRGQILYNIGYYYEDREKDMEKADRYYAEQLLAFEKAIQLDPSNAEAWFNKGYALAGMKRYDEALAAFETVESLDPAYPNLPLSRKQATVLRDAATPVYARYALPLAGGIVLLFAGAGWYFLRSPGTDIPEKGAGNRQARRRNE
jgi:tetratricopeptide (TPR) repeat protein